MRSGSHVQLAALRNRDLELQPRQSMAAVRELFGNRVISRFGDIPWPPKSPDLSVCDFFLWGYLKNRVYTTRPRTLDELKQ
jgi:hypothetical protein